MRFTTVSTGSLTTDEDKRVYRHKKEVMPEKASLLLQEENIMGD